MKKLKKIRPLFDYILTTADKLENDNVKNGIVITDTAGTMMTVQKVIAVGPMVKDIKSGEYIEFNPMHYAVKKFQEGSLNDGVVQVNPVERFNFPIIELGDEECLLLNSRDIMYVIEEFEEEKKTNIKLVKNKIVTL